MASPLLTAHPQALAQLFGQDLYHLHSPQAQSAPQNAPNNAPEVAKVLIVHDEPHLSDQLTALLEKILSAVGIALHACQIVQMAGYHSAMLAGRQHVFLFGNQPPRDFLSFEKYQVLPIAGEAQLIFADPLSQLEQNSQLKKQLWLSMKKAFAA